MVGDKACARQAARVIIERDRRYSLFPDELFDEYAWNMLLHLFVALESNRVMSESMLCKLIHAGEVVGKRWIKHLVKSNLIAARDDGEDIVLTSYAIDRLRRYLQPLAREVVQEI